MYGHSFGGANTAVCCYEDSRFRAGLTLDGVFYQQFIPGNITVPFLYMFAEARLANDSTIIYMWNHTINDTFKMNITRLNALRVYRCRCSSFSSGSVDSSKASFIWLDSTETYGEYHKNIRHRVL